MVLTLQLMSTNVQQHHESSMSGGYGQAGMTDAMDNGATADAENGQTPSDEMSAFNTPAAWTPLEGDGTAYGFTPDHPEQQAEVVEG